MIIVKKNSCQWKGETDVAVIDESDVTPNDFNSNSVENDQKTDSIRSDTQQIVLNSLLNKIEFSFYMRDDFLSIFLCDLKPYFKFCKLWIYLLSFYTSQGWSNQDIFRKKEGFFIIQRIFQTWGLVTLLILFIQWTDKTISTYFWRWKDLVKVKETYLQYCDIGSNSSVFLWTANSFLETSTPNCLPMKQQCVLIML